MKYFVEFTMPDMKGKPLVFFFAHVEARSEEDALNHAERMYASGRPVRPHVRKSLRERKAQRRRIQSWSQLGGAV